MVGNLRHALVASFRRAVYQKEGVILFPHQAEWQLATEGWSLTDQPPEIGDYYVPVRLPDFSVVGRKIVPRLGTGIVAHRAADLAAFKAGKSYSAGKWAAGFACLPDANVQFVGIEYSTSEPEFTYLIESLVSEAGMNLKYDSLHNDPRNGRMLLKLRTGARFTCMSWNQKESLKGKTLDAYIWTEAYQLPGFNTYNSLKQNIRQRHGFSVWVTTPDDPWVSILHEQGHSDDPDWHCTCGVADHHNPYTFDQKEHDKSDPDKGGTMTREKFAVAHLGLLGTYIGKCYNYQRGQHLFSLTTHPLLWNMERVHAYAADLAVVAGTLTDPATGHLHADRWSGHGHV